MTGDSRLRSRLVRAGLMDQRTGATRSARAVVCEGCGLPVWRGLSADWGGYVIDADVCPCSRLGEALALLSGRSTVELRWLGNRYQMSPRDHFRISGSPPGTNGVDVLVRHVCALANGPPFPQMDSCLRDDVFIQPMPDEPPF